MRCPANLVEQSGAREMKFVLKQYDTELFSFDLRSEGLDGFVCTILKKSEKNRRLFPLGLKLS